MPFGVDEAGKGPVFGSMIAACVWTADTSTIPDGIADSKRLSPTRREELAAAVRDADGIRVGLAIVPPDRIDDPRTDMNGLTVEAHADAIADALSGVDVDRVTDGDAIAESPFRGLCDACDTDADRFARRVGDACPIEATIEAEHGADDTDTLVGAASVIAKVERDAHVAAIAAEHGEVGSGYPSDPTTRAFLETYVDEHGELPPFARESWSTCQDVLDGVAQTGLGDFGE